jgi:hypothetical protein
LQEKGAIQQQELCSFLMFKTIFLNKKEGIIRKQIEVNSEDVI